MSILERMINNLAQRVERNRLEAKQRDEGLPKFVRRENLFAPDLGVKTYPAATPYYCASKALESGPTTVDTGGVTWATKPGTWTEHLASDWEEDGTSGDFEYTGSATRKFLVTWSMTLDYLTAGSVYAQRTAIAGKIEKTPSGGAAADVAGSIHQSGGILQYATAGSYYFLNHVSGSVIVSVATGDKLSFRYGFANSYTLAASVSFTATLYGHDDAWHAGADKGVTLNIVPAEFAE